MSRAGTIWSSVWGDREYRKMSVPKKLLFLFFSTFAAQSGGAVSGVYEIDTEEMDFYTGIPSDICKAILEGKKVTVKYEVEE